MKKTIALLAACVLAASVFAGCGNNNASSAAESTTAAAAEEATTVAAAAASEEDAIAGEWQTASFVDAEGTEYTVAEYADLNGVEATTLEIKYTFDGNGKTTCTGLGTTVEGTYTFDGTTVKLTDPSGSLDQTASSSGDSSPSELKLVDGKLVIVGAEYMSFVKQ